MKLKVSLILIFLMMLNLIMPTGIGLKVGSLIINTNKIIFISSLMLTTYILFNRKFSLFRPIMYDYFIGGFIFIIIINSFFSFVLHTNSIVDVTIIILSSISWALNYFIFYILGRFIINQQAVVLYLKYILIFLSIGAIVGILEFIFQFNFYGTMGIYLGLHDFGITGDLWRGDIYRARSAYEQSIAYGFAMLLGFIVVDRLAVNLTSKVSFILKNIFIFALVTSMSRAAILAFCIYILYSIFNKLNTFFRLCFLAIVLLGILLLLPSLENIFLYDESLAASDSNLLPRIRDFIFVGEAFDFSPWFGLGTGILHNEELMNQHYSYISSNYDGALDNMYLAILVESGIIGFISYLMLIIGLVLVYFKLKRKENKKFIFGLIIVFLLASLSYDLFVFPGVGRLLLFLIAVSLYFIEFEMSIDNLEYTNKKWKNL